MTKLPDINLVAQKFKESLLQYKGEDLNDEGQTGNLIPIRSPTKIAEKIELFLDNKIDRKERIEICQKKAVEYSWKNYSNKIIKLHIFNFKNFIFTFNTY